MRGLLEDKIKIDLYNEFYEKNKTLFKKDLREYWSLCRRYCEENYRQRLKEIENKES